jgi:hypothetical protein
VQQINKDFMIKQISNISQKITIVTILLRAEAKLSALPLMSLTSMWLRMLPSANLSPEPGASPLLIYFVCMVIQTRLGRMVCTTTSLSATLSCAYGTRECEATRWPLAGRLTTPRPSRYREAS